MHLRNQYHRGDDVKIYDTPVVWNLKKFNFVKESEQPKPIVMKANMAGKVKIQEPNEVFEQYQNLEHFCFTDTRYCYDVASHIELFEGLTDRIIERIFNWVSPEEM